MEKKKKTKQTKKIGGTCQKKQKKRDCFLLLLLLLRSPLISALELQRRLNKRISPLCNKMNWTDKETYKTRLFLIFCERGGNMRERERKWIRMLFSIVTYRYVSAYIHSSLKLTYSTHVYLLYYLFFFTR